MARETGLEARQTLQSGTGATLNDLKTGFFAEAARDMNTVAR
jgi:hypothetical protein